MIRKINLINCVPYVSAEISNCKKINFIFGSNGSGKSTISGFLSGASDSRYSSCSIDWDSEDHETICVYNKSFRNDNFKQTIPGVFTLGNATIEDINELEKLKVEYAKALENKRGLSESLKKKEEELFELDHQFTEDVWKCVLKTYENDFQKAFEGFRGKKERFRTELERRIDAPEGKECSLSELKERADTLYSGDLAKYPPIELDVNELLERANAIKNDPLWDKSIIGNSDVDIAGLIKKLNNSSWVNQGVKYLDDASNVCPFCQQETITNDFRQKIKDFFNEEYEKNISKINELKKSYETVCNEIKTTIVDAVSSDDPGFLAVSRLNTDDFDSKILFLEKAVDMDLSLIEKKEKNPETKIELLGIEEEIGKLIKIVDDANKHIDANNLLADNQKKEEEALTNDVWFTCIRRNDSLIKQFKTNKANLTKACNNIQKSMDGKDKEAKELNKTIVEKGKNITSVQPAVDEINRMLNAYGFNSFSIQKVPENDNFYCIKRSDGSSAEGTLSEGEETFLTFLYFMQMTKGSSYPEHVSDQKIIVLDDPISSLDSTILYVVGAMVKSLSKDIKNGVGNVKQLFVLTHNVFFHKEASFIDGRTKESNDVNYWIVRKDNGASTIQNYEKKNPITTSYELLWNELKNGETTSLITIQNTMRRIIENYFGIIGSRLDDKLIDGFETVEEKTIARSLLYWINDGSHSIPDDLYIDSFTDAVPKYKTVFKELFDKSGHKAHYNMMMGIDDESST